MRLENRKGDENEKGIACREISLGEFGISDKGRHRFCSVGDTKDVEMKSYTKSTFEYFCVGMQANHAEKKRHGRKSKSAVLRRQVS